MITFFRTVDCPGCDEIQRILEGRCLAHELILVAGEAEATSLLPSGTKPPVLIDGKQIVHGSTNILTHLDELTAFKRLWDKFQSDSCYCHEGEDI